MRRVGEANAEPTRRRVRGNFHITLTLTPTLTPTLSQRERELAVRPLAPFPGDRGRAGARKKENPLIEYRP